jgi:simple sugar transport system permease protein
MEKPQTKALIGELESASTNAPGLPDHPLTDGWRGFVRRNRNAVGALAMLLIFWTILLFSSRGVFLRPVAYTAIFTTLPITIFLVVAIIFTTTNGAIDLSYASTIGLGAYAFAAITSRSTNPALEAWFIPASIGPWVGLLAAMVCGALVGLFNSLLVLRYRLTPFIATLGVNFFVRGLINIVSDTKSIPIPWIEELGFYHVCCGTTFGTFPNQMLWALLFFAITWVLYSKHTIGKHTRIVGDNEESAREMGIPVNRVKAFSYIYTGVAAAISGVLFVAILHTVWPDTGSSYLLSVLTAVFVGGNPLVGGMGTVAGALIGSVNVAFIETGIIAMGFVDVYTAFVYGLVLIISLLGFRTQRR